MKKIINLKNKPAHLIINRLAIVLKEERIANKDLAETLGHEATTISKWATNTIQTPLATCLRIARKLNDSTFYQ